ncbi:hypothetical protein [Myroides sp. DW712]|uniref:hypothetical protein n=1 Tax=Myroides sp. DW712 TaxID=3389800 RepID=UPI00397B1D21
MSYIERKKGRTTGLIWGILLLCLGGVYVIQQYLYPSKVKVEVSVYPTILQVGDSLYFEETTPHPTTIQWVFGDGDFSSDSKGYHVYKKPGFYQLTYEINQKESQTFSIEVKPSVKENDGDYFTEIEAPTEAMQFENVMFRAITDKASLFSWKFGETGTIDAKEPFVVYAFQEAGEYEVYLYTDETAYPVVHSIRIYPSFENLNAELDVEEDYKTIDEDFKTHLQQIADGAPFNQHYNYLVDRYLCENENALVLVNTTKRNSFYYYCMGLRFDRKAFIESVKVGFNEEENCVTKLTIVQVSN